MFHAFLAACMYLALMLSSCSQARQTARLGQRFEVPYQHTVTVDRALKITFAEYNNSRCPKGVECVSAGSATVKLRLMLTGRSHLRRTGTFTWTVIGSETKPSIVTFHGYNIRLLALQPSPPEQNSPPDSYAVALVITHAD